MANKKIEDQDEATSTNYNDKLPLAQIQTDSTHNPKRITQQNLTKSRTKSVTTTYLIIAADDIVICDATGGAFTVTLPTAGGIAGIKKTIKRINSGGNAVTVNCTGVETIDGVSTQSLSSQWAKITVISDGTNWLTV